MSAARRRLRIDLAYDGTGFAGWQMQPGRPTIQGVLEAELARLQGRGRVVVRGAGRTDAGVHARGQVADFDLQSRLDDRGLEQALRRMLPPTVRPLRVRTVAHDFQARKHALAKTYRYRLDLSRCGDPFASRFAHHHPWDLDAALVRDALRLLPGRRDWSGFTAAGCDVENRVRLLSEASFHEPSPDEAWFTFTAGGFLRYMVRNLVGTLLEIGQGRTPPARLTTILATGDRRLAGPTAPAKGLCLERVVYNEPADPANGTAR